MQTDDLASFRSWLAAQLAGETVVNGPIPAEPDRCLGVMDYPGPSVPNWQGDYRVNIKLRGERPSSGISPYQNAHQLADLVIAAVAPAQDNEVTLDLNGHRAILRLISDPMPLGFDDLGRFEMTINVALATARV